ncbi:cobalt-precorrin-5B (C(1))-methyltransferase [Thalassorhabdus alkalitolerans]|uniref:Cobalt-precorrin-5B C(1)-methyltransferase n=1 Tax=Thalassorhabdus alkalitolerans TaxID=2282697 RepID=A0ABW0YNX0_9BACI
MKSTKPKKDPKDMRHGYTTGANATAATKAALLSLAGQTEVKEVEITLPIGERVTFHMESVSFSPTEAQAVVIKDAGDDPDVTHKAEIVSTVKWADEIVIEGGKGVGRVTKTGLPVEVGRPAINPVPMKMLTEITKEVLGETTHKGAEVTISVPEGETIAEKTMNSRIGIIGGISILGTRGTVVPFSTAAFRASIAQAVSVAKEGGCEHAVLSTGGRSEKYALEIFSERPEESFIEMGDFVGFSLKQCKAKKMKRATLVGMIGKFSKVAQGIMMVHSKSAPVDFGYLAEMAGKAGADEDLKNSVLQANTASEVAKMMQERELTTFFSYLCKDAAKAGFKHVRGNMEVEVILITMKNELLGREVYAGEP